MAKKSKPRPAPLQGPPNANPSLRATTLRRLLSWAAAAVGALVVAYFAALVTNLGKPDIEFSDTSTPESFNRGSVVKDGTIHGMLVFNFKMTNRSPFPGFIDRADIIPLNPTTKGATAKVVYIAKQKLYWLQEKTIQVRIATIVPLDDARPGIDPEFRLQLFDSTGQEIAHGPYNLKIATRRAPKPLSQGDVLRQAARRPLTSNVVLSNIEVK